MMTTSPSISLLLRSAPLVFLVLLIACFGTLSPRFLTPENLGAILAQSSWLIVVALGMNFVLLTASVDLSVGAVMYLTAVAIGAGLVDAPVAISLLASIIIGAAFGAFNASLIVRLGLPAFIVTLATIFIGRGLGLYFSSTKIVHASGAIADLGRARLAGVPTSLWIATAATGIAWVLMNRTPFGGFVRSIGADADGAGRAGVPIATVSWWVYALCGAFAGLGGFISLSQTSAASSAFGQGAEFLAIAAAILGGTSLFGGRGSIRAPVIGSILIMTVQNGLVMIDANPYAYPVITGTVIFLATLFDTIRSRLQTRLERRRAGRLASASP